MESLKDNKKVQGLIKEFSTDKEMIDIVNKLESGIKTTQNNYGAYMSFLTQFNKDKLTLYIMAESIKLIKGCNIQGVNSALRVLIGA